MRPTNDRRLAHSSGKTVMRGRCLAAVLSLVAGLVALPVGAPLASSFFIIAYDMPNGDGVASGGTWNYWDRTYSGRGDVTRDAAPLHDGTGKLTDGIVADAPWFLVSDSEGLGPHVGWVRGSATNPLIAFNFLKPTCRCLYRVDGVTIWMDNSQTGGVGAPLEILVNGVSRPFTPPPPGSFGPVEITALGVLRPDPTLQFIQDPAYPWTFVSEIAWTGRSIFVPEPSALATLLSGACGLMLLRRRRRRPAATPV
jgi:hypothetical protein